jgi:hypothetical protein
MSRLQLAKLLIWTKKITFLSKAAEFEADFESIEKVKKITSEKLENRELLQID